MSCIAIIPARGGSRRIPRKNIRMFHGKPIIAYSIETAQKSGLFDEIYVSTDDTEIAEVATKYGASIHWRDADSACNYVGTQEVAARVLEQLGINDGFACVIYPCAPLINEEDLILAKKTWLGCFSMAVGENPLCDAGAFYMGEVWAFKDRIPLIWPTTCMIPIPYNRVCDINTEEDWQRAEQMYAELMENA